MVQSAAVRASAMRWAGAGTSLVLQRALVVRVSRHVAPVVVRASAEDRAILVKVLTFASEGPKTAPMRQKSMSNLLEEAVWQTVLPWRVSPKTCRTSMGCVVPNRERGEARKLTFNCKQDCRPQMGEGGRTWEMVSTTW